MRIFKDVFMMTVGAFMIAFALTEFIVPAHLITSGLAGVCVLLYNSFGWPLGLQVILFNIPLLSLAYYFIGKRFTIYTVYAVVAQSVFLGILQIPNDFTSDRLLASIFGGVAFGFGSGIILRYDGSGGGVDVISRIFARYYGIGVGTTNLAMNVVIVSLAVFMYDVEAALYTLLSIYISAKTYDVVLRHLGKMSLVIITSEGARVLAFLQDSMKLEATLLDGAATRRGGMQQMVYTVVVNDQVPELKKGILQSDPQAFISMIPTHEVIGSNLLRW